MKILIVDDAKLIHFMIKKILTANELTGIEFEDAFDGEEGVAKAKSFQPDLILLDVVMPKKDGIEALKEIVAQNTQANVIMVSSLGTDDKVSQALKLGATAFIQKPFDDDELCTYVKNAQ